jgi:hypothetical protein
VARDPIAVLLLPSDFDHPALREHAEALLRAPGVVALEPGKLRLTAGMADRVKERMARGQARRLLKRLPGKPVAVVVFDPLQWPLAEALKERAIDTQVWGADTATDEQRLRALGVRLAADG